jgi:uncharacterized protein YukE
MNKIAAVLCVFLLGACGGGGGGGDEKEESAPERALQVEYAGKSTVTATDIDGDEKSKVAEFALYFTCTDDDCTEALQRTDAKHDSRIGKTVRLTREGDAWVGTSVASTPCEGEEVEATDTLTWRWEPEGKSLKGSVKQSFAGCGGVKNSSASDLEATPVAKPVSPYLEGAKATAFKAAASEYDEALAAVYDTYDGCARKLDASDDAGEGVQCFRDVIAGWKPALEKLGAAFEPITTGATDACRKRIEAADPAATVSALEAADKTFATAQETGTLDAEPMADVLKANEPFQDAFVMAAKMCVAPDDLSGLGDDGVLVADIQKALVVKASS